MAASIGYGEGVDNTKLFRLAALWQLRSQLASIGSYRIVLLPELALGRWHGDDQLTDASLTPLFRVQKSPTNSSVKPYFEAAIGFHYISEIRMGRRILSTNFQFGDHLGIGISVGRGHAFDICYQFQHLSNASIKRPNSGINFHIVRLGFSF